MAMADANNHAIPATDELEQAVSNLLGAGLVETDGAATRLTAKGCQGYGDANVVGVGHIQRMFDLDQRWTAAGYPPDAPKSWFVGAEAVGAASEAYRVEVAPLFEQVFEDDPDGH